MRLLYLFSSRLIGSAWLFLAVLVTSLSALPTLAQTIRYVKPTATGTGTGASWANASGDLQAMITASAANDQVWVAAGTYKPGGNAPTTGSSFSMKAIVAIYGGFAGTETALSQRTLTTPLNTILSGDIGTVGNNSDNCNRIINNDGNGLSSTAILDGFIISDAAGGTFGGGMYNRNTGPTIRNCLFQNNSVLACCGSGGGMMNWADASGATASPILINCSFLNNSASYGGAIYTYGTSFGGSNPQLTNCSFQGNTASNSGQAIVVATSGGGTANPQATNCIIFGSILMTFSGTAPAFATTNCLLPPGAVSGVAAGNFSQINNITSSVSPFVSTSTTQINDCSLVINAGLNSAAGLSGITTDAGGNPRIFPVSGGTVDIGAYEYAATANPQRPTQILVQPASVSSVCAGSNVSVSVQTQGTSISYQWYKTNPSSGVTTPVAGAVGATLTLSGVQKADEGAYQVVAGCNSLTSTAFTLLVDAPLFVTPAGAGAQNGSSWSNAYPGTSLQTAINAAATSCGKQVWVAAGTYKPNSTADRTATYTMKPGVAIYGGFVGNEVLLSQRPAISLTVPPSTTLSGDIYNNVNISVYNIVRNGPGLTNTAVLDGFVLTLGLGNNNVYPQNVGGAISNNGSGGSCSPTIRNCWFTNNYAFGGGAIYNGGANSGNSSPVISNCRFENNRQASGGSQGLPFGGSTGGGGIMNDAAYSGTSNPTITNCLFKNNSSYVGGGINNNGFSNGVASPTIVNCTFQSNTTTLPSGGGGSAIYNGGFSSGTSSPVITSCSFENNTALLYGGAIVNAASGSSTSFSRPIITNCSFQGNTAPNGGGAVYNSVGGGSSGVATPKLINCVAFGNGEGFKTNDANATITLTYSLFEPTSVTGTGIDIGGAGNISTTVSPFVSTASNVLTNCSVAINAGLTSTPSLSGVTTDVAGNPRITGNGVDMGAYESVFVLDPGTIAGPPIVPFPIESVNTFTSQTAASGTATPLTFGWQYSQDNGGSWFNIANSNSASLNFPANFTTDGNPNKTYQFRRVAIDACTRTATSPSVSVKMIKSNGAFVGQVVSSDGITPVASVTITVVRSTTGLAGSPGSWTYTGITGADGTYNIPQIYYGVPSGTVPTSLTAATFTVTPTYTDPSSPTLVHTFTPTSQTFVLNETNTPKTFNFTDNTTFGISGQTRQVCPDCITGYSGQTPVTGSVTCPVDGAGIRTYRNGNQINFTQTSYLNLPNPGDYGRFAVAVNNPGSYSLSATMANILFVPSSRTVTVASDVYNVNFDSPTSQTITGRIAAGCNEAIGSAVLEFTDVLKDGNGNARPACFRKQVTTSPTGFYTITLPPRKYKVTVISFTPNGTSGVSSPDFVQFINNQFPIDSLTRDLTSATAVTTMNLTYQRPPTLLITGLVSPPGCGTTAGYSLMTQANPTTLTIQVYQGPVATGCPVTSGTVLVSTNTQVSAGENFTTTVTGGSSSLSLVPGSPNVIAPYYRYLNAQFTDAFGRPATPLNNNVVVTGVQAGTATFQTVSPQIPLLVLHDPPGDGSFSYWSSNTTQENAMRFSYSLGTTVKSWYEAKVGVKLFTGLFVITENTVFATLGGGITASARNVNARETIVTTTTSNYLSTNNTSAGVGPGADVFYGTALNMWYAVSTVIAYDPTSCSVGSSQQLIVSNSGSAGTEFYYTADFIRYTSIPNLQYLASISTDPAAIRRYNNQIKVWQQILDNNDANQNSAQFVTNKSFGGVLGDINSSVTKSVQQSNTVEYGVDIDNEVAIALGFEVAGNGFSGGVTVNFKAEIGGSQTNTTTRQVTTGYTLHDNTGDQMSVDVKTDPVYATPVFNLLGGASSCPTEVGTLARDNFQLTAPVTVVSNVAPGAEAQFTLKIGNISQVNTDASRTVWLALVPGSNPDGAVITVNGSPYISPLPYTVNRLSELQVTVRVSKSSASNVFAYQGLQFQISDNCSANGGNALATVALSAFFQSSCSNIVLTTPGPSWASTLADNNSLPVLMTGYTLANLTNVTLQYQPQGGSWTDGFTLTQAQLNNSVNGTQTNWNTSGLADGAYNLRLKLNCPLGGGAVGTVYSQQASGVFDRSAPVPFGNTQPANSTYTTGSTIGISYNEALGCAGITATNVVAKRLSNGQTIPVSVGCYQNQIVVVPLSSLTSYTGEIISLTLTGVSDAYGNVRTQPDSWAFRVGSTTAATGNTALGVTITGSPISESSTGAVQVTFALPAIAPVDVLINFGLAGTATFLTDYTAAYLNPSTQPVSATVNGTRGTILIPAGSSSATLLIRPVNNTFYNPDKTIIISLRNGGDYQISATSSVTAIIVNDDAPCAGPVTTVKAGVWSDPTVWSCGAVPISTDIVQINHAVSMNVNYLAQVKTLRYGAGGKLTYQTGARLRLGF